MIQKFIVTLSMFAFLGCASSKKAASNTTPVVSNSTPVVEAEKEAPKKAEKKAAATKPTASDATPSANGTVNCSSGADKRVLHIKTTDNKGCELHYTKMDNTATVATQIEGTEKCIQVQGSIKGKLEAAGFSCL